MKISVIIPVYNVEEFLAECIYSVINQSLNDIEIICIDDASTDNSLYILKNFEKLDKRIKILKNKKNYGAGISRNIGIKIAIGDFISFLDPDDFYPDNNVLSDLYYNAIKNDSIMCGGNCAMLSKNISENLTAKEKSDLIIRQKREENHNIIFYENKNINSYEYTSSYCYWRFIYKTKFLKDSNLLFPNYRRFQDPPFLAKILTKNIKITCLKRASYTYRINHKITIYNFQKYYDSILGNIECIKIYSENPNFTIHLTLILNDFFERITKLKNYTDLFKKSEIEKISKSINIFFNTLDYNKIEKDRFSLPNKNMLDFFKKILNIKNFKKLLIFVKSFQ